jgi:hypothetical protein
MSNIALHGLTGLSKRARGKQGVGLIRILSQFLMHTRDYSHRNDHKAHTIVR